MPRVGIGWAYSYTDGTAGEGGAKRHEVSPLQIAKSICLPTVHPEQIRGARHVDIKERAAHQEIGGFGCHVLGEFCEPLGSDHSGKPALAAAAHQVRHGPEREFARFVRNLSGHGWSE